MRDGIYHQGVDVGFTCRREVGLRDGQAHNNLIKNATL